MFIAGQDPVMSRRWKRENWGFACSADTPVWRIPRIRTEGCGLPSEFGKTTHPFEDGWWPLWPLAWDQANHLLDGRLVILYWIEIEVISKNIYLIHEEIIKKGSEIIGQLWGHLIKAKREENRVQFREELGGKIQSATSPSEVSSQRGKALSSEQKISKKFWTNLATPAERGWELFWGYNPMAINFVGL